MGRLILLLAILLSWQLNALELVYYPTGDIFYEGFVRVRPEGLFGYYIFNIALYIIGLVLYFKKKAKGISK